MPKKNRKNKRRSNKTRLNIVDGSFTHTLSVNATLLTPTLTGPGSQNFVWAAYSGFTPLADFFQYFKPLRYRVNAFVPTGVVFAPSAFAFYPINSTFENVPTFGAFTHATLTELRGNIQIMPNSLNYGQW